MRVIGTAGGPEKVAVASALGCDHVIDYDKEDVVARVKELTGGAGVNAVFDGVGKRTFDASLACLAIRGMLVLFGQSSGVVPPVEPSALARASLFLTRPSFFHYVGRATSWSLGDAAVRGGGQRRGEDRRRAELRAA